MPFRVEMISSRVIGLSLAVSISSWIARPVLAAEATPSASAASLPTPSASATAAPEPAVAAPNAPGGTTVEAPAAAGAATTATTATTATSQGAVPAVNSAPNGSDGTSAVASNDSLDTGNDSFTGEEPAEAEQQHHLDLYGFADMTYTRLLIPKSDPWTREYFPANSFAVGNFNLYLSSNLGDNWRALGEVRFLYLPNGATTVDPTTGNITRTDTTVQDYAAFDGPIHWGAIRIERVWVEHQFSNLFTLQAGQFLTPYGIWNVDHGSPAIIGIRAPFAVANEFFPAHQSGLQLYGNTFVAPFEIGYHLTLSNGRGPVEYEDFNDDKAVGGRLYLKTDAFGSLTAGMSVYYGGYYDRTAKYVTTDVNGQPGVDQQYTTTAKYRELSLAWDLKWQLKQRLLVQGELIVNQTKYSAGGRPQAQVVAPPFGFQPDYRRWGMYGLVGYRTQFVQTMPYCMVQYVYSPDNPQIPPITGYQFGLNIRPTPAVVLKVEYSFAHFSGPGSTGLGRYPLRVLATQVAWAF